MIAFAASASGSAARHRPTSAQADAAVDAIERLGLRIAYTKDEEIYGQEETVDRVYRVASGAVRTTRLLSDGRRQIGEFYFPGDIFGLEPGPDHRFSAEALCDSEIVMVKRTALRGEREAAADLERMIWIATLRELERAQEHVLLLGRKTACERVASFLLDIVGRTGGRGDLPMGRQDMADYLGLTIETVSRMLTQLQSNSVVEFDALRRFKISNPQAIARLAA
ncbi:MAG: helix-turn-helix domain-containing protein [Caulobacter sp.]|nr:helix-turn-helix domain-containing protein [Caulobacter sp.]